MPIQQVAQGGSVTLSAQFVDSGGDPVDATGVLVDIVDPDGADVVTNASPAHDGVGAYSYEYDVAADADLGRWEAHFTGTVEGLGLAGDDEFDVVTPGSIITSAYDLLTLAEAKAALNIDPDDDQFDVELAMYVTALSQRIDDLCGPVVKRTVTDERHDATTGPVWLNQVPVASVSLVIEYVSGMATTLEAEASLTEAGDYVLLDPGTVNSRLARRSSFYDRWWSTGSTVVVTYVAGRFSSTAAVSPKFKQAAAKALAWLWRGDQGAGTVTFGGAEGTSLFGLGFALPNVVKEMLAYETLPPVVA